MGDKIDKFEDLEVWKESMRFAVNLYQLLKECRDFSLRDKIQRAAVSIPSNIAKGYERKSNKEFIHFLYISKGSCSELRTQLYLAIKTGSLDKNCGEECLETTRKISSMLVNLIKSRKENY